MVAHATPRLAVWLTIAAVIPIAAAGQGSPLKPVSAFDHVADQRARSVALFVEAAKVITSPRCMNCHPATREPTQGDGLQPHVPPVSGGRFGVGVPGLPCRTCHEAANTLTLVESISSIPGSPAWGLAPESMTWQGKTLGEICAQIKDPDRNGGRNFDRLRQHVARDAIVGWGFQPGEGRVPAPGTQSEFAALIDAWITTGAECPEP